MLEKIVTVSEDVIYSDMKQSSNNCPQKMQRKTMYHYNNNVIPIDVYNGDNGELFDTLFGIETN